MSEEGSPENESPLASCLNQRTKRVRWYCPCRRRGCLSCVGYGHSAASGKRKMVFEASQSSSPVIELDQECPFIVTLFICLVFFFLENIATILVGRTF